MELRRTVQFTGRSSYVVTLPKAWAERVGIRKGSVIILKLNEDGGITLYPEGLKADQQPEVEIKLGNHISQQLVGAYLYGYYLIKIASDRPMEQETVEEVKRVVRGLAGAEIVDETPTKIEVQVVLDKELVAPEKMLRRQYVLVQGMVDDAVKAFLDRNSGLGRMVVQRDEEVDRLYFTLVRVIRSALIDPLLAKKLNTTPLTLLDFRVAAKFIEDAGDRAAEIAKEAGKQPRANNVETVEELKNLLNIVLSMGGGPIEALITGDLEKIMHVTSIRREFMRRSESFLKKTPLTTYTTSMFKVFLHLDRICEDFSDIAELGLPFKA
jgi:phosphate uptake regulator